MEAGGESKEFRIWALWHLILIEITFTEWDLETCISHQNIFPHFIPSQVLSFPWLSASVQVCVTLHPPPPPPPVPPPAELFQRFKMGPFVFRGHQDSAAFCFQPLHFISRNKRWWLTVRLMHRASVEILFLCPSLSLSIFLWRFFF